MSTNVFGRQFYWDMVRVKNEYLYWIVLLLIMRNIYPCLLLVLVSAGTSISLFGTFAIWLIILYSIVNVLYFLLSLITTICVNRFHQSRTSRLSKNTARILCNSSISLTDFDGQLMGLILHKGSSTNSGHYISMVNVGDIWFECDDVKITKIEFNHFCYSNTVYLLFYQRSTWWKHLRAIGLVPMDVTCSVSWGEGIETPYSTGSSWRPPFMHCLLSFTFVTFLILWPLSPAVSSVSWYWSCLVWSVLAYEIYSGGGPSMYAYCVVCYRVIVAPYVRSVGYVFAYLYTLDDD